MKTRCFNYRSKLNAFRREGYVPLAEGVFVTSSSLSSSELSSAAAAFLGVGFETGSSSEIESSR